MAPKNVPYPCLWCKKSVAKTSAIGCGTCGLWAHKECEELPDEVFNFLAKKVGGIKWHCPSCEASTARLEASIKQVEMRLNVVEDRMGATEERTKLAEAKADNAVLIAEQAKGAAAGIKDDITKIVFEELSEREDKKYNIIMHNVGESDSKDSATTRKWDEDSFNNITKAMGVNLTFQDSATFCRRLGAGTSDKTRPLLVGLKKEEYKAAILNCASKLAATNLCWVSVVPDLTKKQREMDNEVRNEADRKNREELTEDDCAKNLRWVAVGRKGARKVVKKIYTERRPSYSHQTNSTRPTSGSNNTIIGLTRKRPATSPTNETTRLAKKKQGQVGAVMEDQEEDEAEVGEEEEEETDEARL